MGNVQGAIMLKSLKQFAFGTLFGISFNSFLMFQNSAVLSLFEIGSFIDYISISLLLFGYFQLMPLMAMIGFNYYLENKQ